ncbi:MAG TPA: ABC transporter substrate-binding protein, partial [Streptosporangiaceae bacterium]|nr:ABC transporter substrate-binding protein [Streptosporangiaceae bacterium]
KESKPMRRPYAKTFRLVAMTAASAAVAACGLSSNSNTNALLAGPTGQPITVGISLPLAGPQHAGGFDTDGQATKRGYELWASDVNSHGGLLGRPVKLIILNDKGDPKIDGNNYRTLITQDHVDLTLAPFSSLLVSQAAGQMTQHYGYVLAAGSAGAPPVYGLKDPYLFSTNVPATDQMLPFAKWLLKQPGHPTSAAYPEVDDPFADPPVETAMGYLSAHGVHTVFTNIKHHYSPTASVRTLTADAKQIAQQHHPQIVFLGSIAVATVQAFMKGFQEAKWIPKYFIASSGPDQGNSFINTVGPGDAVGAMVPNGWSGDYQNQNAFSHVMVQDYIAKYGGTASQINADVAEAYGAGQVEAAAVEATHSLNQQVLRNWLHKPTTYVQTVTGQVHFDANGKNTDIANSALIFQWQPGQGGSGAPQFVQVLPKPLGGQNIIPWAG